MLALAKAGTDAGIALADDAVVAETAVGLAVAYSAGTSGELAVATVAVGVAVANGAIVVVVASNILPMAICSIHLAGCVLQSLLFLRSDWAWRANTNMNKK